MLSEVLQQPAKRVKVQIGASLDPSHVEIIHLAAPESHATADPTIASTKTLAELCTMDNGKRSKKKKNQANHDSDVMPFLSKKPRVTKPALPKSAAPTSSSSKEQGPRVEIVDGKIVLKESSLTIESVEPNAAEVEYEEVEEGAMPTSRYSSYSSKKTSRAWGIEETRLFYQALRQCGTDFSMMQIFFPHRTRRELKLKFRREDGAHPELVKNTLFSQLPLELVPFEVFLGVDLCAAIDEEGVGEGGGEGEGEGVGGAEGL